MNRRRIGIVLIVIGTVLALGVGVVVYIQTEQAAEIARRTPTVDVVIAKADLLERVAVPDTAVAVAKVPTELVPLEAVTRPQEVIGKYPLTRIYRNEVVIKSKLADTSGRAVPAFALKEGMVAVTYAGTDLLSATGAIRAGDRVDILLTIPLPRTTTGTQPGGGQPRPGTETGLTLPQVTQTYLQNVEVLRVGNFPAPGQQDGGGGKSITFQVNHQDALILKWAKDSGGVIDLVLRHPNDKEPVTTEPITGLYVFRKFNFTLAEPITSGQ